MEKFKYALATFFLLFILLFPEGIRAGTLQSISDTISNAEPGSPATHTISFTNQTEISALSKIVIKFPTLSAGDSNDEASPSASTFQLNNLGSSDLVKVLDDGVDISGNISVAAENPQEGTSPTVTVTLDSGTIESDSKVEVILGCSKITSGKCSSGTPTILNPTKSRVEGDADRWTITVTTEDSSSNVLDTGRTKLATIESVGVAAQINPILIFSISGVKDSQNVNSGNVGCDNDTKTNTGFSSTAPIVSLGSLSTRKVNISAQLLTVTTNVSSGYSLVASSSGALRYQDYEIESNPTPSAINAGEEGFGIRPCGLDVSEDWGSEASKLYAWPDPASPLLLSIDSSGPVGNSVASGNGIVSIEYAASISDDVPPGSYKTSLTYIVTTAF